MLSIPEKAIRCFETWSHTHVTFYVRSAAFDLTLPETCCLHSQKQCSRITSAFGFDKCFKFDSIDMYPYRDGGLKLCRAGLLEWCMPLFFLNNRIGGLQAGVRRLSPGHKINTTLEIYREERDEAVCRLAEDAPEVEDDEIELIAEGLRQLAARIEKWMAEVRPGGIPLNCGRASREEQIRYLIRRDCTRNLTLKMLARNLSLSEDRMRHVVREITGRNFRDLLTEARLEIAASVLRNNASVPISALVSHCGFHSLAGFHRAFKRKYGCSPADYRNMRH